MKAIMLAAGIGARFGNSSEKKSPKVLLQLAGKTLLERHIEILDHNGVKELVLGVGFNREQIEAEIERLGSESFVRTVVNPDFNEGSVITLWTLRDELCWGGPSLLMDADVLYDGRLIERLVKSSHTDCALIDRSGVLDSEAVKLCIRDGEIVEFRKWLSAEFDFCGESVGFFKLSAQGAKRVIAQTEQYVEQGRRNDPYEEPLRDVFLTSPPQAISYEDISGLPWIEIDSAIDLARANLEVLPRIVAPQSLGGAAPATNAETAGVAEFG